MGECLRLVSANLANRGVDPRAFADLVAGLRPDAVAVQELWPEPARALAAVLPHGHLDPRPDCQGMGIALARPGPVRRLALPFRDAWLAELGAGRVELVNVHLAAPHVPPLGSAVWRRRGQVRGLLAHLAAAPRSRVLVGDLNATPVFPAYRRLAAGLEDGARAAARLRGGRPPRTWGPWPGAPRLLRLDHVLVRGVTVLDCRAVAVPGSDHSALVVDVAVDGAGAPGAPPGTPSACS